MLVQIKKQTQIETVETVELKLPAFFKDYNTYYMIQENSVVEVYYTDEWAFVSVHKNNGNLFSGKVREAIKHEPISKTEFYFILDHAYQIHESEINQAV